jgi:hypothetical protein
MFKRAERPENAVARNLLPVRRQGKPQPFRRAGQAPGDQRATVSSQATIRLNKIASAMALAILFCSNLIRLPLFRTVYRASMLGLIQE